MRTARARATVPLGPQAALAMWRDVERWPSFVEGYARRLELAPEWPAKGARVVWQSAPAPDGAEVELTLDYELAKYGPLAGLADALFIRRALRDALRRTLYRFAVEAEDEAGLR